MGYSPIYNLAISAVLRRTTPNRRLFYMSDTNGVAAAESAARSIRTQVASLVKWLALGSTFSTSLDLGFSNRLAHRSQGIAEGVDLPLLAVDFPTDMKSTVPAPISPALASLPAPRILTIARLAAAKNLTTLASAFSDACQRGMPGSLTIVGEGPERYKLERLVAQADGRVVLAGAIPFRESRRVFGAYDAMVLASLFEPWAIAIIEALGWGLPVLSSRECGAGISMAMEVGDAVKLCGTSHNELRDGLMSFVQQLGRHSIAAKKASLSVRRKFGLNEVADALVALASSPEAVVKRY
jgi:glycosyltransferase involved in cell wall biosynthesis